MDSVKLQSNAWALVRTQYKIISLIGQGTYGTVVRAKCVESGNLVAIKHLTNFSDKKQGCIKVLREI